MKLITLCALFLLLYSCSNNKRPGCRAGVDFIFVNKSASPSTLMVSNGADSVVINAAGNATQTSTLCFKKYPMTDGNYILHIKNARKDTVIAQGYFTNGYPTEKTINVVFEKDTLAFKPVPSGY
jgi:hypothetical protein